ncbi:DUF2332 domain-containing protein [Paenibacillus thermotolerans]|uniref:DUF2332 domain-containing protein n=1 Tax=Paenibacillus thermotolerans TaxID=3027807 RepID=UPI002367E0C1|nr:MULTISPECIES: DUF2332 domain-containing protein [unclassified Paenibacillus]
MKDHLSGQFKSFAFKECKGSSRLYEILSQFTADDEQLLGIASHAGEGQPVPNLFFGAVQYLLLNGARHPLTDYYGSVADTPKESLQAFPVFKDFCLQHRDELIFILQHKRVQTNEVGRCAYLYPCFCRIFRIAGRPLSLIEIGTSAGLQLLWDQYAYSYDSGEVYGNPRSELRLNTELRGERRPFLLQESPPIASRVGVDLHVNDVNRPDDALWLQALIWPEHADRRLRFRKAAEIVKSKPPMLIEGDGVTLLTRLVNKTPKHSVICIFHTHVANQMPAAVRDELLERVRAVGQSRDVFHLYNNIGDSDLHLDYYLDGEEHSETLAAAEGHGRWFEWKQ